MNAKNLLIGLILILFVLSGCSNQESQINGNVAASSNTTKIAIDKIEIYHFHGNTQCYSCKTVGAYAEETVNTYFADELESGKLVFASVNIELPENKELVDKYEAKGSSLLIGIYGKDGTFSKQEDSAVWYKIDNKEDYMNYLKGVIEQKFLGN